MTLPFARFWPDITFVHTESRFYGSEYVPMLDGKEMPLLSSATTRHVYDGGWFVLKIEGFGQFNLMQNHVESVVWNLIEPEDQSYFAKIYGFGVLDATKGSSFELQAKLDITDEHVTGDGNQARMWQLFNKYGVRDFMYGQGKMVREAPYFKIHDFGIVRDRDKLPSPFKVAA